MYETPTYVNTVRHITHGNYIISFQVIGWIPKIAQRKAAFPRGSPINILRPAEICLRHARFSPTRFYVPQKSSIKALHTKRNRTDGQIPIHATDDQHRFENGPL